MEKNCIFFAINELRIRRRYACGACDKKFAKARRLEEHELAVHLKITPLRCTLPGCDFVSTSQNLYNKSFSQLFISGHRAT